MPAQPDCRQATSLLVWTIEPSSLDAPGEVIIEIEIGANAEVLGTVGERKDGANPRLDINVVTRFTVASMQR